MKAELRQKQVYDDIVHLVYWVPEKDKVAEVDLSTNKLDDDNNLTEDGKEEACKHVKNIVGSPTDKKIQDHEKEMEL